MSDYWKKRQEASYKAGEMKVNQYFVRLEKAFNQTKRELRKTVEAFYFRYAEENGLTFAAAQKRLDKAEIGELKDFIELSMANIGKYNQEVNNLSIKARITRYQALEMQIDAMLRELYAVSYEAEAEKTMQEIYGDTYYQTWYNIDQYHGFHSAFAQVDPATVESLLKYPFNGANFSSRLWKQKDHLQTVLMESLTTMMTQGIPPQNLAEDFAKKMKTKRFEAYRLLHTESSFLMSEATHAGYKEDGVEKYEILATLDSKTCGICGELDGKVYLVEEAVTGKNMPPFHCFCRCTDVPYYDDTDLADQTRAARDKDGNPIEVPADMTWKEWKERFLDKEPNTKAEYLIRDHVSGLNTAEERLIIDQAIERIPQKVRTVLNSGTIIDVGQIGASQYDYTRDILYVAKDAELEDVVHEIGHMVENKMLDRQKVSALMDDIIGDVSVFDVISETYEDAAGNPREVFLLKNDKFVSEYQGRLYVDNPIEAFNDDGSIKKDVLLEFISEPFRVYIMETERLKADHREFYDLLKGVAE